MCGFSSNRTKSIFLRLKSRFCSKVVISAFSSRISKWQLIQKINLSIALLLVLIQTTQVHFGMRVRSVELCEPIESSEFGEPNESNEFGEPSERVKLGETKKQDHQNLTSGAEVSQREFLRITSFKVYINSRGIYCALRKIVRNGDHP